MGRSGSSYRSISLTIYRLFTFLVLLILLLVCLVNIVQLLSIIVFFVDHLISGDPDFVALPFAD